MVVILVLFFAVTAAVAVVWTKVSYEKYDSGIGEVLEESYYLNLEKTNKRPFDIDGSDFKAVYRYQDTVRLIDYPNGYRVDLPGDWEFDFSLSKFVVTAQSKDGKYRIDFSRECSPYDDVDSYLEYYNNRFVSSADFQAVNRIEEIEDTTRRIGDYNVRLISVHRTPYEGSDITLNYYTYAYFKDPNGGRDYGRIMIRSTEYDAGKIDQILGSFAMTERRGIASYRVETVPVLPDWNQETARLYEDLRQRDDVMWGAYTALLLEGDKMKDSITELEEKVEFTFPLVMGYMYLSQEPPIKGMQDAYEHGKKVELTLQIAADYHSVWAENPNFQVLDGQLDDTIRNIAHQIAEFGHPVLLRLNNEMNTDWTSYSGVVTMCDPEIYRQVHSRVSRIFEEEGARNVIWIFNPQYGNYPPDGWNNYLRYYSGNDQIQMLGVTGYNTGNYYNDVTGETWNSFQDIYDGCQELYIEDFSEVPWIITEFASSSYGGNKANWIRNMFADIKNYPNIKAAVWFSEGDRDYREGKEGIIARPYYMDENEDTIAAFRDGFNGIVPKKRLPEAEGAQ